MLLRTPSVLPLSEMRAGTELEAAEAALWIAAPMLATALLIAEPRSRGWWGAGEAVDSGSAVRRERSGGRILALGRKLIYGDSSERHRVRLSRQRRRSRARYGF